jgi:hypothetical protein
MNDEDGVIDPEYITSPQCPINWFSKKSNLNNDNTIEPITTEPVTDTIIESNVEPVTMEPVISEPVITVYNLKTKYFFLVLNCLRICYIPLLYRCIKWPTLVNTLRFSPYTMMPDFTRRESLLKTYLIVDKIISKNTFIHKLIQNFNIGLINWLDNNPGQWDEILYDLIYYFTNLKSQYEFITYNEQFYNFILKLIESDSITKNIHIKLNGIKLISDIIEYDLPNYFDVVEKFVEGLLNVHNNLNDEQMNLTVKLEEKQKIYTIMIKLFKNKSVLETFKQYEEKLPITQDVHAEGHKCLKKIIANNSYKLKKLINILLMDISEEYTLLNTLYSRRAVSEVNELGQFIDSIFYLINIVAFFVNCIYISDEAATIFHSKEIFPSLIMIVNLTINWMVKLKFNSNRIYARKLQSPLEIKDCMWNVGNILKIIFENGGNIKQIIVDHNCIIDNYLRFYKNYYKVSISDSEEQFSDADQILTIYELLKILSCDINIETTEENNKEIPDEFIDAITCCLINDPCLLPGMVGFEYDNFFDKTTIRKQLLIKQENPYTRAPLTIESFEEFNKRPDVVEKLEDFKNRLQKYL